VLWKFSTVIGTAKGVQVLGVGSGGAFVLYDACVLYGNEVRDLLMRIAISGMVTAHWTDEILDEAFGNLIANRPDLPAERLAVTRERMNLAVPGALVGGYETLVEALPTPTIATCWRPQSPPGQ
jgi:hypothetical protein